jgi:hypothetical protein
MLKLSSTFIMSEILVRYCYIWVKKQMLAYVCAGLPVDVLSKYDFGFQLVPFIWSFCWLCVRFGWGFCVGVCYV